ncbi:MAG TPA: SGNH/GDSL hydrolase family protein [Aquabacterium sp.]|nr:SGNH/GDSL hydrolase family protein [Aquabacterium sp.]
MFTRRAWAAAGLALFSTLVSTSALAFSKLVVFGDSLSDNGNTYAKVGDTFPVDPYLPGRFSNGQVAVEVMAQQLGITLQDYAHGGALTGTGNYLEARNPVTLASLANTGMSSQVGANLGASGFQADAAALYVVWGGGNDFLQALDTGSVAAIQAAGYQAVVNLTTEIATLYQAGARHFFVPTLPDFAFSYAGVNSPALVQAQLSGMTAQFNAGVATQLSFLQGAYAGLDIQTFDTNAFLSGVRQGIVQQGGTLTERCWTGAYDGTGGTLCSDPSRYFLFDSVHPTAGVHHGLGVAFAAAVPEPDAVILALTGLVVTGAAALRQRRT